MAEAEQLPSTLSTRYYCHQCNREVSLTPCAQLTCPGCSSGFLEEVSDGLNYDYFTSDSGEESEVDESELNFLNLLSIENIFRRTILNDDDEAEGGSEPVPDGRDSPRTNIEREIQRQSRDREDTDTPFIELLNSRSFARYFRLRDVLQGHNSGLRHIGDYLFGDDLDALSTMLLNDTEIAGPPPLPKEQIKLLPVVTISKEDADKRSQCTICMDDFVVREKVKCLPCSHLYHEKCIVPWLERHSTCPNCRKLVEVKQRKQSQSCPRSDYRRNTDQRRSSETGSVSRFFSGRSPFPFM